MNIDSDHLRKRWKLGFILLLLGFACHTATPKQMQTLRVRLQSWNGVGVRHVYVDAFVFNVKLFGYRRQHTIEDGRYVLRGAENVVYDWSL